HSRQGDSLFPGRGTESKNRPFTAGPVFVQRPRPLLGGAGQDEPAVDEVCRMIFLHLLPEKPREISLVEGDRSLFSVLQGAMSVASAGGEDRAPAGDEVVGPLTDADPAGQKEKVHRRPEGQE